ncbi:MAG TPA: hypothetical protein PLM93_11985 [Sulfuricurvum sp.]|nr:MAG: hypothetical protein B7Y30_09545 [Campylobacterales bacterium 16-40-21]OZA01908.1 MAG: hypothetical protein B7X89_11490 [Sulfuricurvum sp. 17-40-25]HQS67896.1 hypothetical protein [Sulfuricurvum sp.]HQT37197.1 hypothetical protein [Sulfuricurvum sp.]
MFPLVQYTIITSFIAVYAYFFLDRPIAEWLAHYCAGKYNDFFVAVTQLGVSTPFYPNPRPLLIISEKQVDKKGVRVKISRW